MGEQKKEPIFHSALLTRVEFIKPEYLGNMMLSIIEFSWFLRLHLMVANHLDTLSKLTYLFPYLTSPESTFTYKTYSCPAKC